MIEATELRKSFGDVVALRGVSFRAEDGQITGLLGPNGAGKTTLLRILYTILVADSGSASVDGIDVAKRPRDVQTRIGVLPHAHGLYERLTSREHIRYFGALHGLRGRALEARIDALIGELDMGDIADRRTAGFSQGQRLKVALARALVHSPQNVLLDEPTNGLDVASTRKVRALIRSLRDDGHAVVFSSHVMHEVAELCDRIVIIARGQVAASGTPDQLCEATGAPNLEEAFVRTVGEEGLA